MNIWKPINKKQKPTPEKKSKEKKNAIRRSNPGVLVAAEKQIYGNSVASRAVKRAGKNVNLQGHAFEIMTCDKYNRNLQNVLQGKHAVLTNSRTAIRDDAVIKQGNKVVGRMQLKDTPKGINDTVKKVSSGQYKGTRLIGTKETKKVYDNTVAKQNFRGAKITQEMTTNGISSAETNIIKMKALGGNVMKNGKIIAGQAAKTGAQSAALSGGVSAVNNATKVVKGEITVSEAVVSTIKETGAGLVSGTVADATGTVVTIALASTPFGSVAFLAGVSASVAAGCVADAGYRGAIRRIQKDETGLISESDRYVERKYEPAFNT